MYHGSQSKIQNYGAMKVIHISLQIWFPIALLLVIFALGYLCRNQYTSIISMDDSNSKAREEIQRLSQGSLFPSEENLQKIIQKSKNYDIDYQLYTRALNSLIWSF